MSHWFAHSRTPGSGRLRLITEHPGEKIMRIGVPREIKVHEYRVGLVPGGVRELAAAGHTVLIEAGAGAGAGITDLQYEAAGAQLVASAAEVFAGSDLIVK